MRKTATSRDVAVGSDMHDYDEVSAKRRRSQAPTRESEIAGSLHDANVAFKFCSRLSESSQVSIAMGNRIRRYGPQQQNA